jgi:arsenate reductase (glutaredoxin)
MTSGVSSPGEPAIRQCNAGSGLSDAGEVLYDGTMHEVTIYHNPGCGTSRTTLGLIRTAGFEPEIIEYLKTPPERAVLESLLERMHIKPRELLRAKESLYSDLGLADEGLSDDELIDYMVANPILINRPIVVTKRGAKLCRPSESVLDILQSE